MEAVGMSRAERTILTNMCMVSDGCGNVLMQNRTDPAWPGLSFPGGHVEPGESIVASVVREVYEETGVTVLDPKLCGIRQFWTDEGERCIVFLFRANRWEGGLRSSEEGEALWLPREGLLQRNCVREFADTLRVYEDAALTEVFYPGGQVQYL